MIKSIFAFSVLCVLSLASAQADADSLRDANTLIRLTKISQQFEAARESQTADIIRTYSIIVSQNSDSELPEFIKEFIAQCYETNYDFDKFRRGIAEILVNTYSTRELALLVDFYRDRGVAPSDIETFREIVTKADSIQKIATTYIFENSQGCIEQGTQSVLDFLKTESPPPL